jgi:hypothetical protein
VTIADLRGFTRAGERLGRSQPAMRLQMKRLQDLIGLSLFDKESGDAKLTEAGDVVAGYARRILALNDEMLIKLTRRDLRGKLRIGLPNDYADHFYRPCSVMVVGSTSSTPARVWAGFRLPCRWASVSRFLLGASCRQNCNA